MVSRRSAGTGHSIRLAVGLGLLRCDPRPPRRTAAAPKAQGYPTRTPRPEPIPVVPVRWYPSGGIRYAVSGRWSPVVPLGRGGRRRTVRRGLVPRDGGPRGPARWGPARAPGTSEAADPGFAVLLGDAQGEG